MIKMFKLSTQPLGTFKIAIKTNRNKNYRFKDGEEYQGKYAIILAAVVHENQRNHSYLVEIEDSGLEAMIPESTFHEIVEFIPGN